jgi:hypothetical protein
MTLLWEEPTMPATCGHEYDFDSLRVDRGVLGMIS